MNDFGEILEPSSRAFWDGFDYEHAENSASNANHLSSIKWKWLTEDNKEPKYSKITSLYVIEGTEIQNFVESTIIKGQKPIGRQDNNNIVLYYFPEQNQIILVSTENNLNISGVIAKNFENIIKQAQNVYTFSLQPKVQYKGENIKEHDRDLIFISGINSKIDYVKEIKSPNFITGIAAAVTTKRFLNNLPYSCYMAYIDPLIELDACVTKPILQLFKDIKINCDIKYSPKLKDTSLLYM